MPIALVHALLRPRPAGPEPLPDALLLEGDRITRVGRSADVIAAAPERTEVIDLGGRTLTPGLQDAHAHFLQMGITARRPSLAGCRSLEGFREAVDEALRERPGDELLAFESWDENTWDTRAVPTRETLDSVSATRPLVARRVCGHFTVANTPALEILSARWTGGGIEADTGHLVEDPSLHLDVLLLPDAEEAAAAFDAADALALSLGVTTSCDFLRPDQLRLWCDRLEGGRARVRVSGWVLEECFAHPEL
ncbi:amidohydrolase family protein, partial [bacterium]|nr:amidohydrolase family protein [bacterium]